MSRSGYTENFDRDWDLIKWRGQVASATRGKRGQAFLVALLKALDDMPEKRLIKHELEDEAGVCAIGALFKARGVDMQQLDPSEPEEIAAVANIAPQLAQETVYMNDEYFDRETPEERYANMREWVSNQIRTGAQVIA